MKQRHSIDIIFSLSIFTVFVICSFLVLLFQAQSYRSIIEQGERIENLHTPLAYIREKIRSNDVSDSIHVTELNGLPVIEIENIEEETITYIYEYEDNLMELYVSELVEPLLESGTPLFDIKEFEVEQKEKQLYVSVENASGERNQIVLTLHTT